MNEWIDELADLCAADEPAVLVTVAGIRGSAPREIGAKMIVTARETIGTIGGGQLEYQCTRVAVGLLQDEEQMSLRSFPLGSSMGQCCGGVVEILFEPLGRGMPAWLRDLQALHGQREAAVIATRISRSAPAKFVVTAEQVFGIEERDAPPSLVSGARSILRGDGKPRRHVQEFYEPIVVADLNIASSVQDTSVRLSSMHFGGSTAIFAGSTADATFSERFPVTCAPSRRRIRRLKSRRCRQTVFTW
jgi:xanthine dehydrogenase accessory factor